MTTRATDYLLGIPALLFLALGLPAAIFVPLFATSAGSTWWTFLPLGAWGLVVMQSGRLRCVAVSFRLLISILALAPDRDDPDFKGQTGLDRNLAVLGGGITVVALMMTFARVLLGA